MTVLLLAAAIAGPGGDSTPLTCDGHPAKFHVQRAKAIIRKAHDTDRFLDPSPAERSEKRAWRSHRFCLRGKPRDKVKDLVAKARAKFDAHYEALLIPPGRGVLEGIAACESHGDPGAVSSDGTYRGKYQFDYQTWGSVGGSGDPAAASEREQDYRAALLYQSRGSQPWPVCG